MKRNTLFGAAALLMAGAAIGGGAVITQNAMADDGQPPVADALTMVNIAADGTALQCTFTGDDIDGLVPVGIPTDDATKIAANAGVIQMATTEGSLPEIQMGSGVQVVTGSITSGAVPASGVVTVEATPGGGPIEISATDVDGNLVAAPEAREGTAEECAAMRAGALADLQNLQAQVATAVSGDAVISTSGGSDTATKP